MKDMCKNEIKIWQSRDSALYKIMRPLWVEDGEAGVSARQMREYRAYIEGHMHGGAVGPDGAVEIVEA